MLFYFFFFFIVPATTDIFTLSLHDALPISTSPTTARSSSTSVPPTRCRAISIVVWKPSRRSMMPLSIRGFTRRSKLRSEEHTSELQSRVDLVCRLLLEKKKKEKQRLTTV